MAELVAHFLILSLIIIGFLIVPLLIGRFVRPKLPTEEKDAIYECGEPTIGTSYIQFDLRFYVVALLFIIFDVEIAFFFPWAKIYGQATQLADTRIEESYVGSVLEKGEASTNTIFPVQFESAVIGKTAPALTESEDKNRFVTSMTNVPSQKGGSYQLRFKSGKLAGKLYQIRKYDKKTKEFVLREDLPSYPAKDIEFVVDNFKKKKFTDKSLVLHWTKGANAGADSKVKSYDPETELLTLASPLPNLPLKSDNFTIADPARVALTEKILSQPAGSIAGRDVISAADGLKLAIVGFIDILVFFVVLLVGFAYVWKRGDLDWVRAVADRARQNSPVPPALANKK